MLELLKGLALALLLAMVPVAIAVLWHNRQPADVVLIDEPDAGPGVFPAAVTCMPVFIPKAMRPAERPRQEVQT